MGLKKIVLAAAACLSTIPAVTSLPGCANIKREERLYIDPIHKDIDPTYKEYIKRIKTPYEAMKYCTEYLYYKNDYENYGKEEYWASFKVIHTKGCDDCDGGATAAAALLSDDGYPARMLILFNKNEGHAVFLYEKEGMYGSIGINRDDYFKAKFSSVRDLAKALRRNLRIDFRYYYIVDFSDSIDVIIHGQEFTELFWKKEARAEKYYIDIDKRAPKVLRAPYLR